ARVARSRRATPSRSWPPTRLPWCDSSSACWASPFRASPCPDTTSEPWRPTDRVVDRRLRSRRNLTVSSSPAPDDHAAVRRSVPAPVRRVPDGVPRAAERDGQFGTRQRRHDRITLHHHEGHATAGVEHDGRRGGVQSRGAPRRGKRPFDLFGGTPDRGAVTNGGKAGQRNAAQDGAYRQDNEEFGKSVTGLHGFRPVLGRDIYPTVTLPRAPISRASSRFISRFRRAAILHRCARWPEGEPDRLAHIRFHIRAS